MQKEDENVNETVKEGNEEIVLSVDNGLNVLQDFTGRWFAWILLAFGLFLFLCYVVVMVMVMPYGNHLGESDYLIDLHSLSNEPSHTISYSSSCTPSPSSRRNFIIISDIHYDPLYSPYAPISDYCRFDLGEPLDEPTSHETYFAHTCVDDFDLERVGNSSYRYGTYGCDSPPELVYTLFNYITSLHDQPEFLMILGDTASHCTYSVDHMISIMDEIGRLLRIEYPTKPIIMAIGNNDVYPHNSLPIGPSEILLRIADIWRKYNFIPESSLEQLEYSGYYSVSVNPKLRLLALNTLYYFVSWGPSNSTTESNDEVIEYEDDPGNQFAWIEQELQDCRAQGQRAYLFSHVGPQCSSTLKKSLWLPQYSLVFEDLVNRYLDVIEGLYFSHVHRDSFNLIMRNSQGDIYAPLSPDETIDLSEIHNSQTLFIESAISPNTKQNPGFRQVWVDENYIPRDYTKHYCQLSDVQRDIVSYPQWKEEYTFTKAYNVSDTSPENMLDVFLQLQTNQELFNSWKEFHVAESSAVDDYDKRTDPVFWCSMGSFCNNLGPCMNNTNIV